MKNNIFVTILAAVIAVSLGMWLGRGKKEDDNLPVSSKNTVPDTLDNKGMGWGLKKVKNSEPEIPSSQRDTLEKYGAFYMDRTPGTKNIYLTFDEGYENGHTGKILDILAEKQVPAAFFITGPYAKGEQALVRRMIDEGHIVGNHTVNHPNLPRLGSAQAMADELTAMNELVEEIYSYKMTYMRPPEGEYSERLLAVGENLGMRTAFWSFAYKDWDINDQKGADYAFSQVCDYLHGGAVILLHAVSSDNADALGNIIDHARSLGFNFSSLDDIPYNKTEDNLDNGKQNK